MPLAVFCEAVGKTQRTAYAWIQGGLPVIYVGRTPYVMVDEARAWLLSRRKQRRTEARRPGRPKTARNKLQELA